MHLLTDTSSKFSRLQMTKAFKNFSFTANFGAIKHNWKLCLNFNVSNLVYIDKQTWLQYTTSSRLCSRFWCTLMLTVSR